MNITEGEKYIISHNELVELQALLRAAYYFLAYESDEELAVEVTRSLTDKALNIALKMQPYQRRVDES